MSPADVDFQPASHQAMSEPAPTRHLPADPAAATEEIQRRRDEIGYSYFVFGAGSADTRAPVVASLAGH